MFRALFQLLFVTAGCLAIAEGALWLRDDGAFPHLNVFVEDTDLAARLQPQATQRVRFGGNPTTHVRINRQGYRGGEWPSDTRDALLVLGDSQAFGLGVEENETFSARLAELTKRPVLNVGVPSFGPPEMLEVARELMATTKPHTLILTINMLDDLFEVSRTNHERHRVWNGWVVRIETAPESTTPFQWGDALTPAWDFVMSKSHLVYGLRRQLNERKAPKIDTLPSEGSWKDLAAVEAPPSDHQKAAPSTEQLRGNPVDIVSASSLAEAARPTELSAFQLQRAAQAKKLAQKQPAIPPEAVRRAAEYRATLAGGAAGATKLAALTKLRELRREPLTPSHQASPLDSILRDFVALCQPPGCEPMLVVLPVDLQVSPDEWRKYELEPHDISDVQSLTDQLVLDAANYGVRALDTTAALQASEPGVFLKGDVHMTPKGHTAVAGAIAAALANPAPLAGATGALPEGRSRVPSAEEFGSTAQTVIKGAEKTGCEAVQVDEWLRVQCRRGPRNEPRRIDLVAGSRDAFVNASAEVISVVAPVLADAALTVDLVWADRSQRLQAKREANGRIVGVLDAPRRKATAPVVASREQEALCACSRVLTSSEDCRGGYGSTRPDCFATYPIQQPDPDACRRLLECAQGFPGSPPSCPDGATVAGGTHQCFRKCSESVPCESGTCVPWPQTHVCMGPSK